MLSDSCEYVTQVGFGVQAVQPRCSYQTIKAFSVELTVISPMLRPCTVYIS